MFANFHGILSIGLVSAAAHVPTHSGRDPHGPDRTSLAPSLPSGSESQASMASNASTVSHTTFLHRLLSQGPVHRLLSLGKESEAVANMERSDGRKSTTCFCGRVYQCVSLQHRNGTSSLAQVTKVPGAQPSGVAFPLN